MDIISELLNKNKWAEFLDYKLTKSHLNKTEQNFLINFVENQKYLQIAQQISLETYTFSTPKKTLINKSGSGKKRVVYSFNQYENIILKFISFCLYKYDYRFTKNTYAFRRNITVKQAFTNLAKTKNINKMFSYKIDISNYFNSINISILLPKLKSFLTEDVRLFELFKNILTTNECLFNGLKITEQRGVMAGTPISTFLANVFLLDLDEYFTNNNVVYARYSDDIILFSENLNFLNEYKNYIINYLQKIDLTINPNKVSLTKPNCKWSYLGFSYDNGIIDLSDVTLKKIKDKIRRKARAIYRWKIKNNKDTLHAAKVLIRVFNNKFYKIEQTKDLTWSRWFFPVINTDQTIKVVDDYLVQYIRFLQSGKFTKKNYNLTYQKIKELGFKSLVHEFYNFRNGKF